MANFGCIIQCLTIFKFTVATPLTPEWLSVFSQLPANSHLAVCTQQALTNTLMYITSTSIKRVLVNSLALLGSFVGLVVATTLTSQHSITSVDVMASENPFGKSIRFYGTGTVTMI